MTERSVKDTIMNIQKSSFLTIIFQNIFLFKIQ